MQLSISNIAWSSAQDSEVYCLMHHYGYSGLEIAPTRLFADRPYDDLEAAGKWSMKLKGEHGFCVPSMQSIWFGRKEMLFGTDGERQILLEYTKKAIDFAEVLGCNNLVFGCPKNRILPDGMTDEAAVEFFRTTGDYAAAHGTIIGIEANPPIYHTNYINSTAAALDLIRRVDSPGFRLNLDVGTMIQNGETADLLVGNVGLVNHVHISEPGLRPIERRQLHQELMDVLDGEGYQKFVSIEMRATEDINELKKIMAYIRDYFIKI